MVTGERKDAKYMDKVKFAAKPDDQKYFASK
jgi:hypothetical protein